MKKKIKIGTRKSLLAMAQTEMVVKAIEAKYPDTEVELVLMNTIGDKILDKPLESFGGKGAFISEFEAAMLSGQIDMAVHSAKDMPICLPVGLSILAVSLREDPRDVLVTRKDSPLKENGIVGTSSLRRQIQMEGLYSVQIKNLRGNVGTRLTKLKNKEYNAIILAAAGLKRLNLLNDEELNFEYLNEDTFIPAAGQGIIAVEGRSEGSGIELLEAWHHTETMYCLETEREVLKLLNAGCSEPIGVYSNIEEAQVMLRILYQYQGRIIKESGSAAVEDRLSLAQNLVNKIIKS
ncbi:MAG: hydroxymethylbilane synthase [Anaerocolumna sp.]